MNSLFETNTKVGTITFTVFGDPVTQGSTRAFIHPHLKRAMVTHDNNAKVKGWRSIVSMQAKEAMLQAGIRELLRDGVQIEIKFYLARPKNHFGKRGLLGSAPAYPVKKPDLDKLTRCIGDALKGVIYGDDSQVVSWTVRKHYGDPPRAEISVEIV